MLRCACRGALVRRFGAPAVACCVLRRACLPRCAPLIVHPLSYARPSPYALPRLLTLSALLCLPRLQLECRRTPISCNRGRGNAPFGSNVCRVCNRNAAERRFYAIAAGRTPLLARMLAAACRVLRCDCLLHCAPPIVHPAPRRNACRVCSWSAAERRFHAIAAGRTPLPVGMFAAFATGMPQNADFVQSRLKKRPFWPEHLPRRAVCSGATACCIVRPLSYTPPLAVRPAATAHAVCSACRVCIWSAADGRFHAIAAGRTPRRDGSRCMLRCDSLPRLQLECRRMPFLCNRGWRTPLLARTLAAFAAGEPQMAGFMQSRLENRLFRPECLPRLQLERCRTPISCNRGRRNAPFRPSACRGVLCAPVQLLAALCVPYRTPLIVRPPLAVRPAANAPFRPSACRVHSF